MDHGKEDRKPAPAADHLPFYGPGPFFASAVVAMTLAGWLLRGAAPLASGRVTGWPRACRAAHPSCKKRSRTLAPAAETRYNIPNMSLRRREGAGVSPCGSAGRPPETGRAANRRRRPRAG